MSNPLLRGSLRLLNAFAGSELAERYGLQERAKAWLAKGAQRGVSMMSQRRGEPAGGEERGRDLFDLTPTEDQELIQQTMRRFAEEVLRPAAGRADDAMALPAEVLARASDLGLGALAVPERYGGAADGRSPVTWTLAAEELARGDMALAWALLAPVSVANLLMDHGTDAQRERWLPDLADEKRVATAALLEPRPLFDPRRLLTRARPHRGGFRIRGDKSLVARGRSADLLLVSADLEGEGRRLFVVDKDRAGVDVEPEPAMGLRGADPCRVRLDVEVPADALVGEEAERGSHQRVVDLARIGWGALAVGQCRAMLEYVIEYCNDRVAFGEPITNRQAVAFLIADMAIEVDGMRLLVWRAASRAEHGLDTTRAAHLVRVQCADKAMKIGTDGVQLLGGAGFIREHPVEMWYRHLRSVGVVEGGISP